MKYLFIEIAAVINKTMIETYSQGEIIGVKEPILLDRAINRPLASTEIKQHSYRKSIKS